MVSRRPNALHNTNKLKLGLCSLNADGGVMRSAIETDAEAEAYYQRGGIVRSTVQILSERKRYAAGLGSHPLIGSPAKIAAELIRLNGMGIDGVTLSFVNFKD